MNEDFSFVGEEPEVETDLEVGPPVWSPDWKPYVFSKFLEGEVIEKNGQELPRCDALRRVINQVMGKIISSSILQLSPPTKEWQAATVACHVEVLLKNGEIVTQDGVADVSSLNTNNGYEKYASATAFTRAESAAFRKLLCLVGVVTIEEANFEKGEDKEEVPIHEAVTDLDAPQELMTGTQLTLIRTLAARCKIDLDKLMEGKTTYAEGKELSSQLNVWQKFPADIPPELLLTKE